MGTRLQNREKVAFSSVRDFFPNLIVPATQALLVAAAAKVEDAHGSIIFLHHRTQPVQFWSMISGDFRPTVAVLIVHADVPEGVDQL